MHTVQNPMPVADFCAAMSRLEMVTNQDYQRSDKVWPPAAKSFLIESIILGFPLPKIFLFQRTDLKSKKTIKEIVDGQQRSRAILDFFNGKLTISKKSEYPNLAGKKYDQLHDDDKGSFLNYQLSIDLFVSASPSEIRQAFRRLNSYTVPLNPEELRHAEYQGEFKWFINEVAEKTDQALIEIGVFGAKQVIRMQDSKLWTEFVHAYLNGFKTTKAKDLTDLYKGFDKEGSFPQSVDLRSRVDKVMELVLTLPEVHDGPLMKPHIFYSLALAISHRQDRIDSLVGAYEPSDRSKFDRDIAVSNLSTLAAAIESDEVGEYEEFKLASSSKTNVDSQRLVRFQWLSRALEPSLI